LKTSKAANKYLNNVKIVNIQLLKRNRYNDESSMLVILHRHNELNVKDGNSEDTTKKVV